MNRSRLQRNDHCTLRHGRANFARGGNVMMQILACVRVARGAHLKNTDVERGLVAAHI